MPFELIRFGAYIVVLCVFAGVFRVLWSFGRQLRELTVRITRVEADVTEGYHNSVSAMKTAATAKRLAEKGASNEGSSC